MMSTGVQWIGTLGPGKTERWYTWGWNPALHVVWYMMPKTPKSGAPELGWEVAVERANATQCTYWITVKNLTNVQVTFEGRYAILS
ncbi:MAG TPA: hypothetical protein PLY52_06550 [Methanothrix sp.]|jgi:glycyl-tRNA synthetase alpha subunit|uniref:hypothetical protein n=1 Tax=Methanothrix sp. TaxID=90426 RepID=UPI002B75FBAC|nr:hypothetical protein [Methanothrix sp.]MDI9417305.1 hypothetical protein [Euryarchaeota archaeon]HON35948.1 hypothetical protein [Methanothrix sp.]HRU75256.1 hypothetical protein [Methanothrix sp.]